MKLIIAGSRTLFPSINFIHGAMKILKPYENSPIQEIVCGGANGVDKEGAHWAEHYGAKVTYFIPDWQKHGKAAGPIRNREMAEYADALLIFWDGVSKGSASMVREMETLGKPIYEVIIRAR
jgi:hypothetical protein